jgi:hypothetical protein
VFTGVGHPRQESRDLVGGNKRRRLPLDRALFLALPRSPVTTLATTPATAAATATATLSTTSLALTAWIVSLRSGIAGAILGAIIRTVEAVIGRTGGITSARAALARGTIDRGTIDRLGIAGRVPSPPASPATPGGTGNVGLTHTGGGAVALRDLFRLLVRVVLIVGLEEIRGVEERALLESDIDERGLDAGKDRFYASKIDVPDHATMVRAIDQQLNEPVVLQNGHPRLARGAIDQDLALHADRLRGRHAGRARPPKRGWTTAGAEAPHCGRP